MTRFMALGEVASYFNGKAFKPSDWSTSGLPIIRIANLNNEAAPFDHFLGEVRQEQLVDNGDLLVSWSASLDAYIWRGGPAVVNQHIFKVYERPSIVDRTYLWYALRAVMRGIRAQVHGATMQHITKPEFERVQIPVPPIELQRRKAAELGNQLKALQGLASAIAARASAAETLRVAILEARLGGPSADMWDRPAFITVLKSPLRTGISGSESDQNGLLGLSLAAVRNGKLDLTQTKRVNVSQSTNRLVREGCFYIVRGNGRLSLVGRAGLAPRPMSPVVFPDLLIEADIDPTKMDSAYFQLVWDTRAVRADIESRARTAAGIHKLNLTNLGQVSVPAPDLSQQRRIAADLRKRLTEIDAMEASIQAEREAIDALPAALLRRAFEDFAA